MKIEAGRFEVTSRYADLRMQEDSGQACIHIWVDSLMPKIEVDCNHIRIFAEEDSDD